MTPDTAQDLADISNETLAFAAAVLAATSWDPEKENRRSLISSFWDFYDSLASVRTNRQMAAEEEQERERMQLEEEQERERMQLEKEQEREREWEEAKRHWESQGRLLYQEVCDLIGESGTELDTRFWHALLWYYKHRRGDLSFEELVKAGRLRELRDIGPKRERAALAAYAARRGTE